jgi:hypothetical protein
MALVCAQVSRPFMVLVCALLAGDARAADALTAMLAQQQLPSVLATIEDYMWCKLTLLLASQVGPLLCHNQRKVTLFLAASWVCSTSSMWSQHETLRQAVAHSIAKEPACLLLKSRVHTWEC